MVDSKSIEENEIDVQIHHLKKFLISEERKEENPDSRDKGRIEKEKEVWRVWRMNKLGEFLNIAVRSWVSSMEEMSEEGMERKRSDEERNLVMREAHRVEQEIKLRIPQRKRFRRDLDYNYRIWMCEPESLYFSTHWEALGQTLDAAQL